jgi:4-amino-4-deoxy-L-arabinose transferase-like glycosyltransferase
VTGLVLAGLALVVAATRLVTYDEPLERDITAFAVIARELIEGRALYSEVWDHKPPAGVVTHALAMVALGYGRAAIYALNVFAAVITLLAVYTAGRTMGGPPAGLWAAAFWTVISGDLYLQGNQPNVEVFINAAVAWAFALLIQQPWPAPGQKARTLAVGALFAVASLYKTVAVAPAVVLAIAGAAWPPGGIRAPRRVAYLAAVSVGGVGVVTWICVSLYFTLTGRLEDFTDAVFAYNRFYAGDMSQSVRRLLTPDAALYWPLQSATPLVCFAVVGVAIGLWSGDRRRWFFLGAWAIGTALAVALPGRFFPHYFQLWLPVAAVAGGWTVADLSRSARRSAPVLGHVLASATLVLLVIFQAPFYEFPPEDWSRAKYRTDLFVVERALARRLSTWLQSTETFYEFGAEPGLYFETGRRPPSGIFYAYPLLSGPLRDKLSSRLIRDLEKAPPDLFIVSQWAFIATKGAHPVLDWMRPRYRMAPFDPSLGPFLFFCRRGSPLEARFFTKSDDRGR